MVRDYSTAEGRRMKMKEISENQREKKLTTDRCRIEIEKINKRTQRVRL